MEFVVVIIYAAILFGAGLLVRNYPECISGFSTMSKSEREEYDMPKIGRFVSKCLYVAAAVALLSLAIGEPTLRAQTLIIAPLFVIIVCWSYLIKYRKTRFKREDRE